MESAPGPKLIDWQQAIASNRDWLMKVLRSRVGDGHVVDDLMQEVALAVVQQSEDKTAGRVPIEPTKVAPFLYRIAVRKAASFHRKANRKSEAKPGTTEVLEAAGEGRELEPLDWLLSREREQTLNSAIEKLDDDSREILMLKYTENWSYRQLAEHIGITEKAVERRLARARSRMRQHLSLLNSDSGEFPHE